MSLMPQNESCSKVTCDLPPGKICMIDLTAIDYQPGVLRQPADPVEQFAYIYQVMCPPDKIPPTVVRFDHSSSKFLIVPNGPEYTDESSQFDAGRKIGLSKLPCRIVGDDSLPPEVNGASSPLSPTGSLPNAAFPTVTDRPKPDPKLLNDFFRELLPALGRMAGSLRRSTKTGTLRDSDVEDWCLEAALALWQELKREGLPRLVSHREVRNYVFGVFHNRARTARRRGQRAQELPDDWSNSALCVADEQIDPAEHCWQNEVIETLQALMNRANEALRDALAALPAPEAIAASAWLDGATLEASFMAGGITLAKLRRIIRQLRGGHLGALLRRARADLEAIYRECPPAAAQVYLGNLTRLLEDPIDHS